MYEILFLYNFSKLPEKNCFSKGREAGGAEVCISMDTSPEFTSVKKKTTPTQVFRESVADLEEGPRGPGLPLFWVKRKK